MATSWEVVFFVCRYSLGGYVLETIRRLVEEYAGNPHLPRLIFIAGEEYYEKGFGGENEGDQEKAHDNFFHAIKIWDVVIHDLPEDPHFTPMSYYLSGACFRQWEDYESAIFCYEQVVKHWPQFNRAEWAQFRIAHCYDQMVKRKGIPFSQVKSKIQDCLLYTSDAADE